jgi:hypothetical protein
VNFESDGDEVGHGGIGDLKLEIGDWGKRYLTANGCVSTRMEEEIEDWEEVTGI